MTKGDMRKALDTLPSGLDNVYADALSRIQDQGEGASQLALRTLMWVSCAKRPLSIHELQMAVSVGPESDALDSEFFPALDTLVSITGGLLTENRESGSQIVFVHYTVQEYFEKVRDTTWVRSSSPPTHKASSKPAYIMICHYSASDYSLQLRCGADVLFASKCSPTRVADWS